MRSDIPPAAAIDSFASREHATTGSDAEQLRAFLAGRDQPCPRCQYNLRDLHGEICPECGDALQLQVGVRDPKMTPFIVLMTTAGVGVGGHVMFTVLAAVYGDSYFWQRESAIILLVNLAVSLLVLTIAIVRRRRFRRLSVSGQWVLAIATMLLTLTGFAVFIATFKG